MKPEFDNNGLATQAGNLRVYYYDADSKEYIGWSDEYINLGVSMPGCSTPVAPEEAPSGMVAIFSDDKWNVAADHRGETVYSTVDGAATVVNYIGELMDGFTASAPSTPYDQWNGSEWVTDKNAAHAADVADSEQRKQELIAAAQQSISLLQTKLLMGRTLTDAETNKVNKTLDYIDAVEAIDTATAPGINFPQLEV